jgi:hypothetical protein
MDLVEFAHGPKPCGPASSPELRLSFDWDLPSALIFVGPQGRDGAAERSEQAVQWRIRIA